MTNPNPHKKFGEELSYSTIRLQTDKATGTGFVLKDISADGEQIALIITNRHVVEEASTLKIDLHIKKEKEIVPNNSLSIMINDIQRGIIYHPDLEVDLAAIPIAPITRELVNTGSEFYISFIDSSALIDDNVHLEVIEDVIMVGYPIGLYDPVHNLPIFRKGITASNPNVDFGGRAMGAVDIAAFPGSSGSPIYVLRSEGRFLNEFSPTSKPEEVSWNRRHSIRLLGVLFAGPHFPANGDVQIVEVPTQQIAITSTSIPIHIGYYIKAREVRRLLDHIYKPRGFVPVYGQQGDANT